jgi:hypothetical protein
MEVPGSSSSSSQVHISVRRSLQTRPVVQLQASRYSLQKQATTLRSIPPLWLNVRLWNAPLLA